MAERPDPAAGVYETVRVLDGRIQLLDEHLARLAHSLAAVYARPLPPEAAPRLRQAAAAQPGEARIRIDVVPEDARLSVNLVIAPVDPDARRPVALAPAVVPGGLGPHKWRDRRIVDGLGADPVPLLVDTDGTVLEAAWGNVWLLDGDRLTTPGADGRILPGVTRNRLRALAPALGLTVEERSFTVADVRAAPSALITSSVRLAVAAAIGGLPAVEPPQITTIREALAVF
jgi:para-aminobenzoate synthetase/4-amino-4-deoxychorismate lyase